MNRFILTVVLVSSLFAAGMGVTHGAIFTAGFEGIAPTADQTSENNSTRIFGNFEVFTPHGHYVDSAQGQSDHPDNGTDFLIHDYLEDISPVEISMTDGGVFSILKIDASEWSNTAINPLGGRSLFVTGHLLGGGTIETTFTTDSVFGFETFTFDTSWSSLVQVDLLGDRQASRRPFGTLAYDNVTLDDLSTSPVPVPAAVWLFGTALIGLVGFAKRRRVA